jgi:hypothetical protein
MRANFDESPDYASEVPYVPVNWEDRDTITRRVCDILEAVMPEGNQLEKTKDLVKEMTKQYWIQIFNDQFNCLQDKPQIIGGFTIQKTKYSQAIWEVALGEKPTQLNAVAGSQIED